MKLKGNIVNVKCLKQLKGEPQIVRKMVFTVNHQ